jgi:hypothetical protein
MLLICFRSTHEQLQERALQQDRQIEELLLQYDKLKREQKIKEWMSRPLPTLANGKFYAHQPVFRLMSLRPRN